MVIDVRSWLDAEEIDVIVLEAVRPAVAPDASEVVVRQGGREGHVTVGS